MNWRTSNADLSKLFARAPWLYVKGRTAEEAAVFMAKADELEAAT